MNLAVRPLLDRKWKVYSAFFAALLLLPVIARAQGFGTIVGTVTDPTGAAIPSATVTATATKTGVQTKVVTNGEGGFTFPTLLPTEYSISVAATGFEKYTQTGVVLQANQSATLNVHLQLGASTQTVTVSGGVPQVDTTSGTLSQVVDQDRVVDLPLNGRNAATLITLVAGVAAGPSNGLDQGTTKTFPVAVSVTSNGTQVDQTNYLLNGGNNVDEMTNVNAPFPFPDALQEFSVQTSNYSAQYGQSAGAVVNIVTRSGTEQFHGSAFEFLRNGYFNAKPYFATSADALHRHQFGGTIGGPVILPHISSGKLTQFFFGYQHTLYHLNSSANSATVPTLAEEGRGSGATYADYGSLCSSGWNSAGYCNTASQQIYNPFTGAEYSYNQIPASDFDPAAVQFLQHIPTYSGTPAAGKVGGTVNFFKPTIQAYNEYFGRVDHSFGSHDHMFVDYYLNDFAQDGIYNPNNLLTYASFSNIRYQNALISETHIFTSSLLNNLIVNYQREISLRGGPSGSPDVTNFGVQNVWQPPQNALLNHVSASGYFTVSGSAFADFARNNYTLNDDIHWTKGTHNLTFGGHIELSKYDLTNVGTENGSFSSAAVQLSSSNPALNYVNAMANFQMGYLSSFVQGGAEFLYDRNHFPGLYAQDSWKINRRLTLNYGVRWEDFAPWSNKLKETTVFSSGAYSAGTTSGVFTTLPAGLLVAGDPGVVTQGVRNQYKQFMPRVGFAFDVFGDGRSVLRGGGGIFYQDRLPGFFNQSQGTWAPYTISVSQTDLGGTNVGGPLSNPYCTGCTAGVRTAGPIANPFPYTLPFASTQTFPTPLTVTEYDPSGNFRVPVTDDYNLTFEQQFLPSLAMRLAYVGSVSRHQFVNLELNPAVNNGTSLSTNQRRPYNTPPFVGPCTASTGCKADYAQIIEASMSGAGNYNSLQATLEKRMSHGLSLLLNYTWSKAMDDLPYSLGVSNDEDLNAGESYVYPVYPAGGSNWYPANYKALDYGPSDFDHPNVISASYVYALPHSNFDNRAIRTVLNGWRTSGLIQHRSGDALTVTAGKDVSLTGLNQDRGERTAGSAMYTYESGKGSCSSPAFCVNWLDPSAFSLPVNSGPGTGFGNVIKGSVRGPGYTDWDAAVIRTFHIYRESNLDFRAEYFDVLNHTILNDPSTAVSSATFGQITGENTAGPRIAQFSMKLLF
jgi:hypothetical protein